MASDRFSFDRAAGYYDATRALPEEVAADLTELLVTELDGRTPGLEIGVGTGRIALPLHRRGVPLVGVDVAEEMLKRLVANAGAGLPFAVVLGDASSLPFATGSVGAVMASHVLHLLPGWRAAVDEAMRALRPGAPLLVDFGGAPKAPWHEWTMAVFRRHGIVRVRPGASSVEEVTAHLGKRAAARRLRPLRMPVRRTLARDLEDWEGQIHSWTWPYPADQVRGACAEVRARAHDLGWSPDRAVVLERTIQWWAFDRVR